MANKWRFSSKLLGLRILKAAVRRTSGKVLRHLEITGIARLGRKLRGIGHTILVRSDQLNLHEKVSGAKRSKQPRQHFPNTFEGRKNAREFIKAHLLNYGLFVQHLSKPRDAVRFHGRIFINPNGNVWVYIASPNSHNTFARWHHELIARYNLVSPENVKSEKNGLNKEAFIACKKVARNIFEQMCTMSLADISRTVFVIYKDQPAKPEFYDLLFIQGMKRPSSRIF